MGIGVFLGGVQRGAMDAWRADQDDRRIQMQQDQADLQSEQIRRAIDKQKAEDDLARYQASQYQKIGTDVAPAEVGSVQAPDVESAQQLAAQNGAANVRSIDNAIDAGVSPQDAASRPTSVVVGKPKPYTEADYYKDVGKFAGGIGLGKQALDALGTARGKTYEQALTYALTGGRIDDVLKMANAVSPDGSTVQRVEGADGSVNFARVSKDGKVLGALPWQSDQEAIGAIAATVGEGKLADYLANSARTNEAARRAQTEAMLRSYGLWGQAANGRGAGAARGSGGATASAKGPARDFSPDSPLNVKNFETLWGKDATGAPMPGMADYYAMATDLALNNPDFQGPGGDARAVSVVRQVANGQVPVTAKLANDGVTWSMVAGGDKGAQVVLKRGIDPLNSQGVGGKLLATPETVTQQKEAWFDNWMQSNPQRITALAAASQSPEATARVMREGSPTDRAALQVLQSRQQAAATAQQTQSARSAPKPDPFASADRVSAAQRIGVTPQQAPATPIVNAAPASEALKQGEANFRGMWAPDPKAFAQSLEWWRANRSDRGAMAGIADSVRRDPSLLAQLTEDERLALESATRSYIKAR